MRVAIGWVISGTLLAMTVLGAASAQNNRGAAIWAALAVVVAAGSGALSMATESARTRDAKAPVLSILRPMLSVAAGVVTLLGTAAAGCDDEGGVPSWERCDTWLGNPTVDWPGAPLLALALSLGVGYLVWRLLGRMLPTAGNSNSPTTVTPREPPPPYPPDRSTGGGSAYSREEPISGSWRGSASMAGL